MSVLGACWRRPKAKVEKQGVFGKESMHKGKRQLEGNTTRVHAKKATTGRKNNTHAWEEDLMTVGLGFW
jgi:hypothetical protein